QAWQPTQTSRSMTRPSFFGGGAVGSEVMTALPGTGQSTPSPALRATSPPARGRGTQAGKAPASRQRISSPPGRGRGGREADGEGVLCRYSCRPLLAVAQFVGRLAHARDGRKARF